MIRCEKVIKIQQDKNRKYILLLYNSNKNTTCISLLKEVKRLKKQLGK